MANDLVERAKQRFAELSALLERADAARDEHANIQRYLILDAQMRSTLGDKATEEDTAPTKTEPAPANGNDTHQDQYKPPIDLGAPMSIPDRAEHIIRQKGRAMHLSELFVEMRKQGWKATGDDAKDKRNLAASLWTRKGDRFINVGNNTWQTVPKKGTQLKMGSTN